MFEGSLDVDASVFDSVDWRAVFEVYSDYLALALDIPEDELPTVRDQLTWMSPEICACGEHWPLESIAVDAGKLGIHIELVAD